MILTNFNMTDLNYGEALEHVKKGRLAQRKGWNGKGMFIFMRPEGNLSVVQILGLNTMPVGVKDYYEMKNQPIVSAHEPKVTFTPYLCMKAADDTIVNGWLASQTDMLANDWQIVEGGEVAAAMSR